MSVAAAAVLWAGSGTAAQHFFLHSDRTALELTNIRMILAGLMLLPVARLHGGLKRSLAVLKKKPRFWADIAIYSVVGILFMQYTYFQGIAVGNAAATTVICYTCPAMVICWDSFHYRRLPRAGELSAVVLAIAGIFLLVTGGNIEKLSVPLACMLWSLASGAFFAFSSIYPRHLLLEIDQYFLLAAGMLFGGLVSCAFVPEFDWRPFFSAAAFGDLLFIIVFGTAAAFLLFNTGLVWLTPEEATITATVEPAASVVLAAIIFDFVFGPVEMLGIAMVIGAIIVPLIAKQK